MVRPGGRSCWGGRGWKRAGFTLIEMVVVIGIVLIIMGIALPSVNTMWAQHRENDANNGIAGMLMSTRAQAIQADRGEVGMFFYLDSKGVQQIAIITRDPRLEENTPRWQTLCAWRDVFTVAKDGGRGLLSPMRAVPRYVVDDPSGGEPTKRFSPIELGNDDFDNLAALEIDTQQRHRNYFVILFSAEGRLILDRNVLIRDPDEENNGKGDGFGDITGLRVANDVQKYFDSTGEAVPFSDDCDDGIVETIGDGNELAVDFIVPTENRGAALNFPSVDGVMVYDDSVMRSGGNDREKRQALLETARPYYIHRLSGSVVRGPVGEVPPEEDVTP